MTVLAATIGSKALYLLFVWLLSSAGAAWMADRKGYGERLGLTFGLILTAVGFLLVLLLPARPGSAWKLEGPLPRRSRAPGATPRAPRPRPPPPATRRLRVRRRLDLVSGPRGPGAGRHSRRSPPALRSAFSAARRCDE